jgi:hypothetical protein
MQQDTDIFTSCIYSHLQMHTYAHTHIHVSQPDTWEETHIAVNIHSHKEILHKGTDALGYVTHSDTWITNVMIWSLKHIKVDSHRHGHTHTYTLSST